MAKRLQLRKGTTAEHSTFTGAEAEVTVDTSKNTAVIHDGATLGGFPLLKESTHVDYVAAAEDRFVDIEGDVLANTASIVALEDNQQSGVIVFQTYALLDAYTPTTEQQTGSFKVVNDPTSSLNGYYAWVSDTTYTKDASLVSTVIDKDNTTDAVSGSAVVEYSTEVLIPDIGLFNESAVDSTEGGDTYSFAIIDSEGAIAAGVNGEGTLVVESLNPKKVDTDSAIVDNVSLISDYGFAITDSEEKVSFGVTDTGGVDITEMGVSSSAAPIIDEGANKYEFAITDNSDNIVFGITQDGTITAGGNDFPNTQDTDRSLVIQRYKNKVHALIRRGRGLKTYVVGDSVASSSSASGLKDDDVRASMWASYTNMFMYGVMQGSPNFQPFTDDRPRTNDTLVEHSLLETGLTRTLEHSFYQSDIEDPNNLFTVYYIGVTDITAAEVDVRVYIGETPSLYATYKLDTYIDKELVTDLNTPTPQAIGYQLRGQSFDLPNGYDKVTVQIDTPVAKSREGAAVAATAKTMIVGTALGNPVAFRNGAVSGAALRGREVYDTDIDGMFDRALAYDPDIYIIALGQNDSNPSPFPDADTQIAKDEFRSLLIERHDSIIAANPRALIVLVPPLAQSGAVDSPNRDYADIIKDVAYELELPYLDMQTLFNIESLEGAADTGRGYKPYLTGGYDVFDISNDGIHPTGLGQVLISESLSNLLGTKIFSPINK